MCGVFAEIHYLPILISIRVHYTVSIVHNASPPSPASKGAAMAPSLAAELQVERQELRTWVGSGGQERGSGDQGIRGSGDQGIRGSGDQEMGSGGQEMGSGVQEVRSRDKRSLS